MDDIKMKIIEVHDIEKKIEDLNKKLKEKKKIIIDEIKEIIDNKSDSVYIFGYNEDTGREIFGVTYKKEIQISQVKNIDIPYIINKIHKKYKIGEYEVVIFNKGSSGEYKEKEKKSDILIRFEW